MSNGLAAVNARNRRRDSKLSSSLDMMDRGGVVALVESNYLRVVYIQPNCFRLIPSFQIFVMWRIRSPSNCMA